MHKQNNLLEQKKTHNSIISNSLIEQLYNVGVIQFGKFKLKSGIIAPIYIDLRRIISYPNIMKEVLHGMGKIIKKCEADSVCGVPYAGIPLAAGIALLYNKPMIMPRKEAKTYGAKRSIEGIYKNGDTTIIIEDIITTGTSIKQTYEVLINEGIAVQDVIVFCDRRSIQEIKNEYPYNIHTLFTLTDIINYLHQTGKINAHTYKSVQHFLTK